VRIARGADEGAAQGRGATHPLDHADLAKVLGQLLLCDVQRQPGDENFVQLGVDVIE
jgi:hypothetical protein